MLAEKSVGDLFVVFQQQLQSLYPEEEIKSMVFRLFDHYLGWNRADIHLNKTTSLDDQNRMIFEDALKRLLSSVPIQYITGSTRFMGLNLIVTPDVLIPRPETEEMAALIIREQEQRNVSNISFLDIGTGSGCLALAMKDAFPRSDVTAIDNSRAALEVARQNAGKNHMQINFQLVDILRRAATRKLSSFNIIISNPPYIPESDRLHMHANVLDHEPGSALFVTDEDPLLFYRTIADFSMQHLKQPGILYVEIHERFGQACASLLLKADFNKIEVLKDMHGKDRFIRASL